MDLIQSYHDQESQSSSSGDESRFLQKNDAPSTSYSSEISMPKMVSNFEPLERIPIDRLMIATAAIAAKKPTNQKQKQKQAATGIQWLPEIERDIRMCLGSILVLQKHTILECMDRFISKLTKDSEKTNKPRTADTLAHYIRTYLHICKYLFRTLEKGKRYYKRFIRLLSIYTDLELCASIRGAEYDKSIAERIVLLYQSYLDHSDNSMVLDVLLGTKRLWRQHRGILVLLFEYFLVRKTAIELPDTLFMKNLIMFKKWLYIEEVPEERRKARDAFVRFVKPKKTICMNSLFKPYLPVDEEGFVTITDSNDILNKEYALSPLIRSLKKSEVRLEVSQNEEVIVLTDDETENDEDDSFSNHGASSASYSHHDEMSNDTDWYSASSQYGNQSQHSQNVIETVSIDSPPPPSSFHRKTTSLSSLDSCDLNLDTTSSLVTDRNGESAQHSDAQPENPSELPSTSTSTPETRPPEVNGENTANLSTLDESMFNRLVNDINSTHVSIPGNGSTSSDIKVTENGESSRTEQMDVVVQCENGIVAHTTESVAHPSNGDSSMTTLSSGDNLENHFEDKLAEPVKTCDNHVSIISSGALLKNHEDTLRNIDEIVTHDLKNHEKSTNKCSTSNDVQKPAEVLRSRTEKASSPIPETNDVQSDAAEKAIENVSQEFVPAAESTATVANETSLLSKSEQDVLFKDREAALIFNDLLSNGPTIEGSPKPAEVKSPRLSSDSPIEFLQNGTDPNFRLKTYTRRNRKVETKTISTQTSRFSMSGCPSPVTTIDENNSNKKDKYLLTEKEDDELFLRDIFNTSDLPPVRSGGSPRIRSPLFAVSTPVASTPIASTSTAPSNISENVESTVQTSVSVSDFGSAEVVVKRKRGRPRKYPLPEPGTTPIVPKPPKAPRQPRKPKPPKEPTDTDEEVVFEKRVLRPRKPRPAPPPTQPPAPPKQKTPPESKSKRAKRRNTIKMTIDAIFNTQSMKLRAIQARRISQILGIPITSPQIATILKRRNYNKTINNLSNISGFSNIAKTMNSDSSMNDSSMLKSFKNRSNGQMNSTAIESNSEVTNTTTQSTILARKTYIKPNITLSALSSFSSALRRISFSSRRISFSSTMRHNRTSVSRKPQSQQRYAAIDIFDTAKKRGRKKGSKDKKPRKKPAPRRKAESKQNIATNAIVAAGDQSLDTIELVDLTTDYAPYELDATNEMNNQFDNIHSALSSTQQMHNISEPSAAIKRRNLPPDDTDFSNEFTTDPESAIEDIDDSHTRKSNRSRKRRKILDL